MTLNMTTQICIIRLRNIVEPICLMIIQRHLFICAHFTKEILEYSMIQYEIKNTISYF